MGWVSTEIIVSLEYHSMIVWHSWDFWHCRIAQGNSNICDWSAVTSLHVSCCSWLFSFPFWSIEVTMETSSGTYVYSWALSIPGMWSESQLMGWPESGGAHPCGRTPGGGILALVEWQCWAPPWRGALGAGPNASLGKQTFVIPSAIAEWWGVSCFLKAGGVGMR